MLKCPDAFIAERERNGLICTVKLASELAVNTDGLATLVLTSYCYDRHIMSLLVFDTDDCVVSVDDRDNPRIRLLVTSGRIIDSSCDGSASSSC